MTGELHQSDWQEEEEDGWLIPQCTCGWRFGPVPDLETLVDVLMDHAYEIGKDNPDE